MSKPVPHYGKWRIRWITANGQRKSETFADRKDALYALKKNQLEAEEVKRGQKIPIVLDKTFSDACTYWLNFRAPKKRSHRADRSMIEVHLRPFFGSIVLKDIGTTHVDQYKALKTALTDKTLANQLTLLISILNLAVELRWLNEVPKIRKPKTCIFSSEFRYLRTEEEVGRFLRAAYQEGESVYALYACAIYTGMRAGELAGLQWDDIDFSSRLITVQRSFNGPTKSGEIRYVPILDPLLPTLLTLKIKRTGKVVFENEAGQMHQPSARIFQEILHRVISACRFKTVLKRGKDARYITFHSLRHTFASHWMMSGGDLFKLQRILGHKSIVMTERYSHLSPQAFADDLGRLGNATSVQLAIVTPLTGRLSRA